MEKIACQRCIGHNKEDGCSTCGGLKVVLSERMCESCGHISWVRPGAYSSYEGKVWYSFDGVKIIDGKNPKCGFCIEEK